MTNYEQLFQEQMNNFEFAKAYYEARLERILAEMLDILKDKICQNESKENLIKLAQCGQWLKRKIVGANDVEKFVIIGVMPAMLTT